jgi:hypothetical protein
MRKSASAIRAGFLVAQQPCEGGPRLEGGRRSRIGLDRHHNVQVEIVEKLHFGPLLIKEGAEPCGQHQQLEAAQAAPTAHADADDDTTMPSTSWKTW